MLIFSSSSKWRLISPSSIISYQDLIDKIISLDNKLFKISGFIDTGVSDEILSDYKVIYENLRKDDTYLTKNNDFITSYSSKYSNLLYVSKPYFESYINNEGFINESYLEVLNSAQLNIEFSPSYSEYFEINYFFFIKKSNLSYSFFNEEKTSLNENEVLVPFSQLKQYIDIYGEENLKELNCSLNYTFNDEYYDTSGKVVGYFLDEDDSKLDYLIVDDSIYNFLTKDYEKTFYRFIFKNDNKESDLVLKQFIDNDFSGNYNNEYVLDNRLLTQMVSFSNTVELLKYIVSIVVLILAIFSMVLFGSFISNSISYKKKEIGILRALGTRKIDVFSIFFFEGLAIDLMNFVLSLIGSIVLVILINNYLVSTIHVVATYLSIGFIEILLLLLISILASTISTFIPTFIYTKKNPFEAINDK